MRMNIVNKEGVTWNSFSSSLNMEKTWVNEINLTSANCYHKGAFNKDGSPERNFRRQKKKINTLSGGNLLWQNFIRSKDGVNKQQCKKKKKKRAPKKLPGAILRRRNWLRAKLVPKNLNPRKLWNLIRIKIDCEQYCADKTLSEANLRRRTHIAKKPLSQNIIRRSRSHQNFPATKSASLQSYREPI